MKKIGLICLALVVALGGLGAAYAMWSDTVTVTTTVNTGTVSAELVAQKSNDPGTHGTAALGGWFTGSLDPAHGHQPFSDSYWTGISSPIDPTSWTWYGNRYEKNVASANCDFTADTLTITIDNAYPSYGPDVAFGVKNTGTIPVKIYSIKLKSVTTPAGTFPMDVDVDVAGNAKVWLVKNDGSVTEYNGPFADGFDDAYAFGIVLTSVGAQPLLHTQIEPGGALFGDVGIHVAQAATQTAQYAFSLEYMFCNWNEIP